MKFNHFNGLPNGGFVKSYKVIFSSRFKIDSFVKSKKPLFKKRFKF